MHKILMIPVSAAILLATGACATTDRLTESGLDPGKFNAVVDGCPVALYTGMVARFVSPTTAAGSSR